MQAYDTLTEAIEGMRENGYVLDFNIAFDKIQCAQNGLCLNPDQFEITEFFRFEGNSDPADESVLYAIESKSGDIKGLLVDGYGTSSDSASDELIHKLAIHKSGS